MILMWLGSLTLILAGLYLSQNALAQVLAPLRTRSLDALNSSDFKQMLRGALLFILGTGKESETSSLAVVAYNYRLLKQRGALLLLCSSLLGLWWPLVLSWGYLQYNGLLTLGLASILWLLPWGKSKAQSRRQWMIQFLFGIGLFYFGAEVLFKNSSLLLNILNTSDFAFWLVDKNLFNLLAIMILGMLLTHLVRISFWTVILAIAMMMSGSITFVGGLFLFLGERIAGVMMIYAKAKKAQTSVRKEVKWWLIVSLVGLFVGAFAIVSAALSFNWGAMYGGVEPQVRNQQFLIAVSLILFFQFLAQMIWGHFASTAKKIEPESEVKYINWEEGGSSMSPLVQDWLKLGLEVRLEQIQKYSSEVSTSNELGIPADVKNRVQSEAKILQEILASATE